MYFFFVFLSLLACFFKNEKVDKTSLWPMFLKDRAFVNTSKNIKTIVEKRVEKRNEIFICFFTKKRRFLDLFWGLCLP